MTTAALASLLPLPVAIPIAGAVAAPLAARISARLPLLVSLLALAGSAVVLLLLAPAVFDGHLLVHYMGHWTPVAGAALGIAFAADPFGMVFALATTVVGALLLLSTLSELGDLGPRELGGYACLFQLLLAALVGAALTADLFNLYVWFEVAALASYGLTGFFLERPIALEAAFKVLVLTTLAGFAIFIGAGLLYADHGALNFGQLHDGLATSLRTPDVIALALLVAGFATKAGLVPFHGWLPDAHTAAPGPVSALFSGLMVNLGIIAVGRVVLQVYGLSTGRPVLGLLMVLGVVSALLGAVMALVQDDLKRLLAFDTVSQMGVLVVGIATASSAGVAGAVYHLVNHALFKSLLFLCAGAILHATGATRLSEMGGLAAHRPGLAAAFSVGVLAIAGLPPLNGYVSLGLIHEGLQGSRQHGVVVALLVAQVVTVAALGRAAYLAFFRRRPDRYEQMEPLRPGMRAALTALATACFAFGVVPTVMLREVISRAAGGLLAGADFARGVLSVGGQLPAPPVAFDYGKVSELLAVAATAAAGVALTWVLLRNHTPRPLQLLRRLHTGSVNDYAAFAVVGILCAVAVLVP